MNFPDFSPDIERMKIASFLFRYDYFEEIPEASFIVKGTITALFESAETAAEKEVEESLLEIADAYFDYLKAQEEYENMDDDEQVDNEPQEPPIASYEQIADFIDDKLRSLGIQVESHRTPITSSAALQKPQIIPRPGIDLTAGAPQVLSHTNQTIHL